MSNFKQYTVDLGTETFRIENQEDEDWYRLNEDGARSGSKRTKAIIPEATRWRVWERDNFTCQRCGSRNYLAVDHIFPESKGGGLVLDNLQTLCKKCNSLKGNRT